MINDLKFAFLCQSSSKVVKPKVLGSSSSIEQIEYNPPDPSNNYPPMAVFVSSNITGNAINSNSLSSQHSRHNQLIQSSSRDNIPNLVARNVKLNSEIDIRPLNGSIHRNSSRIPLYHYDDCALVNSVDSTLNYRPSTSKMYRTTSQSQTKSQLSSRSVQYLSNHLQNTATNSSKITGKTVGINGIRRLNAQSNSCSDLVMHEVTNVSAFAGMVNQPVGIPMRAISKMYSQSFNDEQFTEHNNLLA